MLFRTCYLQKKRTGGKSKGCLGCSAYEVVEFKILGQGRENKGKKQDRRLELQERRFRPLGELLGRISWNKIVERSGVQESQLTFKGHLLQNQEWSILRKRKSTKDGTRLAQMSKELLKTLKYEKENVEKLE